MAESHDPDRLAAIEAELARLRSARERDDDEKRQVAENLHRVPVPQHGFAAEQLARQEKARQERARVHAEWSAAYEKQMERARPKIERLEAELAQVGERRRELERRHAAALAKLDVESQKIAREIGELSKPPAMPGPPEDPDAPRFTYVGWHGRPQWVKTDEIERARVLHARDQKMLKQGRSLLGGR